MYSVQRPHKFRDPIHGFIYVSDLEKKIIEKITEKINIQRIYSDEKYRVQAKATVNDLLPQGEDYTDDE